MTHGHGSVCMLLQCVALCRSTRTDKVITRLSHSLQMPSKDGLNKITKGRGSFGLLQCVAVRCSALQCVAVRCSALTSLRVAVRCSALQCVTVRCNAACRCLAKMFYTATHCNTLQHTATHCNTLQHTATRKDVLNKTTKGVSTQQSGALKK